MLTEPNRVRGVKYEKLLRQKIADNLKNMLSDFSGMEQLKRLFSTECKHRGITFYGK